MKILEHNTHDVREDASEKVFYDNPEYPSFIRTSYIPEGYPLKDISHWHEEMEFIYVTQGNTNYNVNNEIIPLKAGEGIFVNSRQMHFIFAGDRAETRLFCALLHPMLLGSSNYIKQNFVNPLMTNSDFPYLKLSSNIGWQKEILDATRIICEDVEDPLAELIITKQFFSILISIYHNYDVKKHENKQRNPKLSCLLDMVSYIGKHYKEKITLEDLCHAGNISKTSCSALFKEYTTEAPIQYLLSFRLEKAANLLKETKLSITEICFETGFSGASYFSEYFKKRYGVTPREYRNKS